MLRYSETAFFQNSLMLWMMYTMYDNYEKEFGYYVSRLPFVVAPIMGNEAASYVAVLNMFFQQVVSSMEDFRHFWDLKSEKIENNDPKSLHEYLVFFVKTVPEKIKEYMRKPNVFTKITVEKITTMVFTIVFAACLVENYGQYATLFFQEFPEIDINVIDPLLRFSDTMLKGFATFELNDVSLYDWVKPGEGFVDDASFQLSLFLIYHQFF